MGLLDKLIDKIIDSAKKKKADTIVNKLAKEDPEALFRAPVTTPVGRLDEVKAAKDMRLSHPVEESV